MLLPTVSPNDEVLVKDVDGAWKIYTGGRLIALESQSNAKAIATPPVVALIVPAVPDTGSAPIPIVRQTVQPQPGKPVIADIRAPKPIVVGPVEELRMTLEDYLRSGATAGARADGIRSRIKQLEAQDYSKRVEGVTSWKRSEVYSLYVVLGQESVLSGTSLEESINKRKNAGQPTLSVEDFQAITKLNNDLRN
ncbi:hypothetical protein HZA86_02395 [Candidatus Uhrbacteria bacterium]|nr:hypothetical protein [Candidatus Uhrbacteria bacterium]